MYVCVDEKQHTVHGKCQNFISVMGNSAPSVRIVAACYLEMCVKNEKILFPFLDGKKG